VVIRKRFIWISFREDVAVCSSGRNQRRDDVFPRRRSRSVTWPCLAYTNRTGHCRSDRPEDPDARPPLLIAPSILAADFARFNEVPRVIFTWARVSLEAER
jgi:hypothetical protein